MDTKTKAAKRIDSNIINTLLSPYFAMIQKMGGFLEIVCINDTEFDGGFMSKNNNKKNRKNIKVNDVLDMSYRKNIIIDSD